MSRKLNTKDHRARKSMGAAEEWRKQKKARNAARPKQTFCVVQLPDGTSKVLGPVR